MRMTSVSSTDSTSAAREAQRRAQELAAKQAEAAQKAAQKPAASGMRSEAAVEEQQRRSHDVAGSAAVNEVKGEAGKAVIGEPKRDAAPPLPKVAAPTEVKGPQTDRAIEHARQAQVLADNKQVNDKPITAPGGKVVNSEQELGLRDPASRVDTARKIADDNAKDSALRTGFSGQQDAAEKFYAERNAADKAKLAGTEEGKAPSKLRDAMLNNDGTVNTNVIQRTVTGMQDAGHDISENRGSWAQGVERTRNDTEASLKQQAEAKFQNTKDSTPIGDTMVGKAVAAFGETAYGRYTKGFGSAIVDAAVGIKDMAVGAANLTGINGEEAKKGTQQTLQTVATAITTDPKAVLAEVVKPITERVEKGDYAGALGYGTAAVIGSVLGGKGLEKATTLVRGGGALSKGDDVAAAGTRVVASQADEAAKAAAKKADDAAAKGNMTAQQFDDQAVAMAQREADAASRLGIAPQKFERIARDAAAELHKTGGEVMAAGDKIKDVNRLTSVYGGKVADWDKVRTSSRSMDQSGVIRTGKEVGKVTEDFREGMGASFHPNKTYEFEVHAYRNRVTGEIVEPKIKVSVPDVAQAPSTFFDFVPRNVVKSPKP
jgi:hypothetical protein